MQPTPQQATPDLFRPLLDITERYRRDVHQLSEAATEDALRSAESHLGHRLPKALGAFLRRWNGATLFRGALLVRSTTELASAEAAHGQLVAFADGPGERKWAFSADGRGGWVFGEVIEGQMLPLHVGFHRWLEGTIRLLDENVQDRAEELELRLECDPQGGHLLLAKGEAAAARGESDAATRAFREATVHAPGLVRAWQRLGESLLIDAPEQARKCLIHALHAAQLPVPYPGASTVEPGLLKALGARMSADSESWEGELERFLESCVEDVRTASEADLHEGVVLELGRLHLAAGRRDRAREVLARELERSRAFAYASLGCELRALLADVEVDLGEHDAAEEHLRPLRDHEEGAWRARASLSLGRIAVMRQEPWAEEILQESLRGLMAPGDRALCHLLIAERCLLFDRLEAATGALGSAKAEADMSEDRSLGVRVSIGLGDLARAQGDLPAAETAWRKAREQALESDEQEILLRLLVRRGELHRATDNLDEAEADFLKAAEGYALLQLPMREAWALTRAARVSGNQKAMERARQLFLLCDLSAGVAAIDAITEDPGRSLSWHLQRSTEHARARHEAQRARPPYVRADADRPERRLGAHRIAISAGSVLCVETLEKELDYRASRLEKSTARALDPDVAAYIASADLLAHHRSYEAAQVLLTQLLERKLPDIPSRALRGAITRSPNAALADGLLSSIEGPQQGRTLSAAVEVLGWRREEAALPRLLVLAGEGNSLPVRQAAVVALGRIGARSAVDALLPALSEPRMAANAAVALLLLGDRRGVDFHAQSLAAGTELDSAPGEIVGRYGGPSYLLLLRQIAEGDGPRALGALQGLGYLGDPRGIGVLLSGLGKRDPVHVAVAAGALELITGHREELERPGLHACWEQYWHRAEAKFSEGVRYRDGKIMSLDVLVDKLGHDDPLVRRGSYDELVISTGFTLPFDADGPYRVQNSHRRAWYRKCRKHSEEFTIGGWWFDGNPV